MRCISVASVCCVRLLARNTRLHLPSQMQCHRVLLYCMRVLLYPMWHQICRWTRGNLLHSSRQAIHPGWLQRHPAALQTHTGGVRGSTRRHHARATGALNPRSQPKSLAIPWAATLPIILLTTQTLPTIPTPAAQLQLSQSPCAWRKAWRCHPLCRRMPIDHPIGHPGGSSQERSANGRRIRKEKVAELVAMSRNLKSLHIAHPRMVETSWPTIRAGKV
jgi:hypothetical protein